MTTKTTDQQGWVKPFGAFLQEHKNGHVHAEAGEKLRELVNTCIDHQKTGSLVLTIKVKPDDGAMYVVVEADVKVKMPTAPPIRAVFYADDDGNLVKNDPRQQVLPLREVTPPGVDPVTGEVKDIAAAPVAAVKAVE